MDPINTTVDVCRREAELRYQAASRLPVEHTRPLLVAALLLEGAADILSHGGELPLITRALGIEGDIAA